LQPDRQRRRHDDATGMGHRRPVQVVHLQDVGQTADQERLPSRIARPAARTSRAACGPAPCSAPPARWPRCPAGIAPRNRGRHP
jgi:hypothetical protein